MESKEKERTGAENMNISKTALVFGIIASAINITLSYIITNTILLGILAFMAVVIIYNITDKKYGNETIEISMQRLLNTKTTIYKAPIQESSTPDNSNLEGKGTNAGRLTDHLDIEFYRNRIRSVY